MSDFVKVKQWHRAAQTLLDLVPQAVIFREALDANVPWPLAIGTREALETFVSSSRKRWEIRKALRDYCRCNSYREAVANDLSERYGIDGEPVGYIPQAERTHAMEMLRVFSVRQPFKPKPPFSKPYEPRSEAVVVEHRSGLRGRGHA